MPHLATKINCAGDKCGECKHQREKTVELSVSSSLPLQSIFAVVCCVHGDAIIIDGNRVPECLAGELRVEGCDTCGHHQTPEVHGGCPEGPECEWIPNTESSMQPATKGER